ncbi:MAG: two-component system, LytTR family, sensor kinase [Pseudonocardiales bacterium]|jgi:two-component system LytT family sensor kinase|nr:two-component system, LytTR family, sensor kinase [Pseudonocardiales bacterium]MDT7622028.1 two-component system, LytTR family, sensor kinase [Pseudonocardiales bacterium]MDT7633412.1 two-component system, LytTR family, sensor kinase [Pseudonocardiales bacterium]MDT7644335.1 two-component system, LytTR family, sensor kinase [Pseudonocardiales bacterium]
MAAAPEPGRPRRSGWWRRGSRARLGPDAMAAVAESRRVAASVRAGLDGPGALAAARRLRRLLGADAVGLSGLSGVPTWSGHPSDQVAAAELLQRVLRTDARAARGRLVVLPLHARDEFVGALVIDGEVANAASLEAAALLGEALDRARLEASADVAEQAELRALRAEISPHFVYNSLTAIASFVESDPERARDLLLDFAAYTRHSLARHGDYTTVAGEFQAIEAYLALARAVLGERLRVQVRIAPEILPVALPYLALQPLVENAVRHGVELTGAGGFVQVSGQAEGTECVITVEDDGPGMAPGYAADVLAGRGRPGSLGLMNVDRRLRTVFGPGYGLVIETADGAGTKVVLRVPRFQPGVVAQ